MTTDPVCGVTLAERDAVATSFYNGRVYLLVRRSSVFVGHGQGEGPRVVG